MAANNSNVTAQNTMTLAQYGLLRLCTLPAGVTIQSSLYNNDGTVTVVFQGKALGLWAYPIPVPCEVGLGPDCTVIIQPIGGSSSSSSGL
jgi:hypothetical protein